MQKFESAHKLILSSPYITHSRIKNCIEKCINHILQWEGICSIIDLPLCAKRELIYVKNRNDEITTNTIALGIIGWAAWTYIDSMRDTKKDAITNPDCIAIFSILISIMHEILRSLHLNDEQYRQISNIIGMMECANIEEQETDNVDTPESLGTQSIPAWKSMGAALPLLSFMMSAGANCHDIAACKGYFYHLIMARQLSDDALDWKEDKENGIKTVVTELLQGETAFDTSIKNKIAKMVLYYAEKSVFYAKRISCFKNIDFLTKLPRYYANMARNILASHADNKTMREST